ncbi:MAG: alanine--tRNA ligase-related protein [Candidatus Sungbacteria bacterium]|nr:alanine--tRNA ligase-related protein [Candidatus Sungbacteria bacterium]
MESSKIRKKFLEFFEQNGHAVVPSSSLIPDDPSVLLTTAGVQQFKPYYTGEADPIKSVHPRLGHPIGEKSAVSIQKSFRTSDIEEVGDERHLTFFEMLGNFSFGGYFKKEAIRYAFDFITKEMMLEISYVTIFSPEGGSALGGEGSRSIGVPKDNESRDIWRALGITDIREEGMEDVFWGPTGNAGPCGPTTEIYCKNGAGQDIEVWNIVFNEFFFNGSREELLFGTSSKKLEKLKNPGVDTGMGLERLVMCVQKTPTIFETDLFAPLLELLPKELNDRQKRIIADHLRGAAFLIADGVRPSNKEAGYILRRLMRRVLAYEYTHAIPAHVCDAILHDIVHEYGAFYPEVVAANETIRTEFSRERERFVKTIANGMRRLDALVEKRPAGTEVSGKDAFDLYQTYGLTEEIIAELLSERGGYTYDHEGFHREFRDALERHQEISRVGQEKKFGGHGLLLDTGELKAADVNELKIVTRLHTATHLLQAALRKILGAEVSQRGSDITVERTRFDFSFSRKVTPEEIKKVEDMVNDAIGRDLVMDYKEMAYTDAVAGGALHFFREKYPERVKVYSAHDSKTGEIFSRELCGGPHVSHTGEIGHFRITKEESSSAGIRRIRAVVE